VENRTRAYWRWLLLGAMFAATSARADPSSVTLAGRVQGASGKYAVFVALWRRDGFLERPAQGIRIEPRAATTFSFKVPRGEYAVSAFEDKNGNGVLDMGLFGPKEPHGFFRPFTAWRKPKFDDVAVLVEHDLANAAIDLR
jgi:uncharacterized protein (DUF2141 family)